MSLQTGVVKPSNKAKEVKFKLYVGGGVGKFVTLFNNSSYWMFLLRYLPQSSACEMPSVTCFHPLGRKVPRLPIYH